jgi:redox-sensitive bicupin YhaK (pirin superfamily)
MATKKPLVITNGQVRQILDADDISVSGVLRPTSGTLSLGTDANTTAVTISRTGITTTVAGDLQVSGTETVIGTTTFQGDTNIGDASTDTLTITAVVDSNITFEDTSARSVLMENQASVGAAAQDLTLGGGAGGTGAAAASPTAAGVGSDTTLTGGTGGAGVGTNTGGELGGDAGVGGTLTIQGGVGGAGQAGSVDPAQPGDGGAIVIAGGAGGAGAGTSANSDGANVTIRGGATGTGGGGAAGTAGAVIIGDTNTTSVTLGTSSINTFVEGALRLGEIADPTNVADKGFLYAKDDGGDTELFYRDDSGNVVQITQDGSVNATGGAISGTNSTTFAVNEDAIAGTTDGTCLILEDGDGGSELIHFELCLDAPNDAIFLDAHLSTAGAGQSDRSSIVYLGPKTQFTATTIEADPTLNFRGHTNGDAVGVFKTSSIVLDSSADDLIITGPSGGTISAATNFHAEAGLDVAADNQALTVGASGDLSIVHNGANTIATTITGDFTIDNTNVTGSTIMLLGTDTSATDFQVQNNSASPLFLVDGSGLVQVTGTLQADGNVDLGNASTDTLTLTAVVDSDLTFQTGAERTVQVEQAANETAGDVFHFHGPQGGASAGTATGGAGGGAHVRGGHGGDGSGSFGGGTGGATTVLAGDGGAGTATAAAGAGGQISITGGPGGTNNGGGGGNGGAIIVRGGNASGAGTDGTVTIGDTNTSAVNIGATAITTQISGTLAIFNGTRDAQLSVSGNALVLNDQTDVAPQVTQLDTTQRDNLTATNGMIIYNITTGQFEGYDGAWSALGSGGAVAGTDSETFTINQDAAATDVQDTALLWEMGRGAGGTTIQAFRILNDHDANGSAGSFEANLLLQYANNTGGAYTTLMTVNGADDSVTFAGNVNASAGLDVNADNQALTVGAGADLSISHDGANTTITSTTGNLTIDNTAAGSDTIFVLGTNDNTTEFQVQNNSTTPYLSVRGDGRVDVSDGTLDIPAGTSLLINGVALTTANFTAANMDTLLDGSNADSLHTHASVSASEIKSTGWTETESIPNGGAAAITGNDSVSLADASSGSGDTAVAGISETDTEVTHAGRVEAAIFVASLTLAAGDQVYVSKTAGRLTNDVSGFTTGDTVIPMGIVRDASTYGGTGDDPADIILNIGNTTVL